MVSQSPIKMQKLILKKAKNKANGKEASIDEKKNQEEGRGERKERKREKEKKNT